MAGNIRCYPSARVEIRVIRGGLALAGVIFGLLGAMAAARLIQSLLYETAAIDPASYAVAASVLLGVAAAAAWSPARRAASIDPIVALRQE